MYQFTRDDALDFARHVGIKTTTKGDQLIFRKCPFCGQTSDDKFKFAISLKTGQYNCFRNSCGATGNMITLSKTFDFPLPGYADEYYNARKRYIKFPTPKTIPPASERIYEYLRNRGISRETADKYGLTADKNNPDLIVIPFYSEKGELESIKYRDITATKENGKAKEFFFKKSADGLSCKPILFGMQHCSTSYGTRLVMTEGQLDSLSCAEAGVPNAVSVPTGAKGFTWLSYCWDFIHQFEQLVVFGDFEKGKISLLDEMKRNFGGTVFYVTPEGYKGCKDANEILQKYGKEAVLDAVIKAEEIIPPGMILMKDVKPDDLANKPRISTGFNTLDEKMGGFTVGTLNIITGETGLGKSTLASQFATYAVEAGLRTFIYSGELSNGNVRAWFDIQCAGPGKVIKVENPRNRHVTYGIKDETRKLLEDWYGDKLYLYNNDFTDLSEGAERTVISVIEKAAKDGCKFILIDNIMTAVDEGRDWLQMQTTFVKKLKQLVATRDVIIVLVAHMRKSTGYKRSNEDVAGSSNITNLADSVISLVQPDDDDGEAIDYSRKLILSKNRANGECIKSLPLYYDPASRRLSETHDFSWQLSWLTEDMVGEQKEQYEQTELPFEIDWEGGYDFEETNG